MNCTRDGGGVLLEQVKTMMLQLLKNLLLTPFRIIPLILWLWLIVAVMTRGVMPIESDGAHVIFEPSGFSCSFQNIKNSRFIFSILNTITTGVQCFISSTAKFKSAVRWLALSQREKRFYFTLQPITHNAVELMNAVANQRSSESLLKCRCSGEFSSPVSPSAPMREIPTSWFGREKCVLYYLKLQFIMLFLTFHQGIFNVVCQIHK